MNKLLLTIIFIALLASCQAESLTALLYCYLPAVNTQFTAPEYTRLAEMINQKLQSNNISVTVSVCNEEEAAKLYDANQISSLFDTYDIVQVDVSYLWAVKTDLLSFSKDQIDYEDTVFSFQWAPVTRKINGEQKFIGSPGLLCSNFIEKRVGNYYDRLYSDFSRESAYGLVTLYLSYFVNEEPSRTLQDVNYSHADPQTIRSMAEFLKKCQNDPLMFEYESNWCLRYKQDSQSFLNSPFSTTTGYSENLFNFINAGIKPENIEIQQIPKGKKKRIFYADQFVAKNSQSPEVRKTVLDFYKFMLSDEILSIYVQGKYTKKPGKTYIIPPTIDYLKALAKQDKIYKEIYETGFNKIIQLPIYQPAFAQNVYSFAGIIDRALKRYQPSVTGFHPRHPHIE